MLQPLPRRKDDIYVWVVCRHYPLPRLLLLVGAPEYAKEFVVWCPRWHWPSGGNDPSPIATLSHAMNHVPWRRGPRQSKCVAPVAGTSRFNIQEHHGFNVGKYSCFDSSFSQLDVNCIYWRILALSQTVLFYHFVA